MKGKIDCLKVCICVSNYATKDNMFDGAFAAQDIKKKVEIRLMRRLGENFDRINNSFLFLHGRIILPLVLGQWALVVLLNYKY